MAGGVVYAVLAGPACLLIKSSLSRTSLSSCMSTQQQQHNDLRQSDPKLPFRWYNFRTRARWIEANRPGTRVSQVPHYTVAFPTHIETRRLRTSAHSYHCTIGIPADWLDLPSGSFE